MTSAENISANLLPSVKQFDILTRSHFLSGEECDELIAAFERCQAELKPTPGRTDRFFDNRFLWINSLPTATERRAKRIMQAARFSATDEIARFYDEKQPLYSDTIQLVKWPEGIGMPVHADNSHPDGSAHPTAYRKYASVVYLNDDYGGGELFLPTLGLDIKPEKGLLVAFRGDRSHEHGVRTVTKGTRYTMPAWYTNDISRRDVYSLETY
jgi:predicted 2-oxoglutarate/Fe(II)-dependent dioxygenase YbiX